MYHQYTPSFQTHSSLYIFILYGPYSEIYLDIICNDLITLVPTRVQCEVSSCHWISYPSFKSHGWVPLPSKNLLPTSALNNSLHRHHKQCRSKGAWQLLPATQVRSWVGVTSERDAAYTRGQVDKRTRPGHKHRERASKIQEVDDSWWQLQFCLMIGFFLFVPESSCKGFVLKNCCQIQRFTSSTWHLLHPSHHLHQLPSTSSTSHTSHTSHTSSTIIYNHLHHLHHLHQLQSTASTSRTHHIHDLHLFQSTSPTSHTSCTATSMTIIFATYIIYSNFT